MESGKNDIALSVDEIVRVAAARLLSSGEGTAFSNICTDSRDASSGSIFFALKGERTDGHNYIRSAVANGASLCVIDHLTPEIEDITGKNECAVVLTENSLTALQKLAAYYRRKFRDITIVGITGSSGKTTTKELTAAVLSQLGETVYTKGNLNSEIGLPCSVFSIRPHHRYGVFEMGINHFGEMDILVDVLQPQIGIITNIGTAHIGILGSRDNIAAEKGKLFSANPALEKGFISENDDYYGTLSEMCGREKAEGFGCSMAENLSLAGTNGSSFTFGKEKIDFPLVGKYNVCNAMAAAAVGKYLGASDLQIRKALENAPVLSRRGEICEAEGVSILCDCYNANLEAVKAVIGFAGTMADRHRLVFVIGSLLELGDASRDIHREIGTELGKSNAAGIFLFGKETEGAEEGLAGAAGINIFRTEDYAELEAAVCSFVKAGDLVVVKGSRGMELERIVNKLKDRGIDNV